MAGAHGTYQVDRSTGRCEATGTALDAGTPCVAALCDDPEGGGFRRLDYSEEAWKQGARPEGLFSFWRTAVPEPKANKRLFVDDEVLLDLLDRLGDAEEPKKVAFRFVITLVLLRKRLVKFERREETPDGVRWHLSGRGGSGGIWSVHDPELGDEDIVDLHEQLGEVLQGEL
ncbi:MAG: hypothetical protein GY894_00335 [Planctomycetes bacterium]|jgi:hypothetical protein|nr:hypothetical protein [Planctomycetota bacterium]MCP4837795.1 hypothetical protein [Planctomycetota bacterium]